MTQFPIPAQAVTFVAEEENFSATPYTDEGHEAIGYGHDLLPGESFTPPISEEQAQALLAADLQKAAACIATALGNVPLTDNQLSALLSLCFNIGCAGFLGSTVCRLLKTQPQTTKNIQAAADAFLLWDEVTVRGSKVVDSALVTRRKKERALFLGIPYVPTPATGSTTS